MYAATSRAHLSGTSDLALSNRTRWSPGQGPDRSVELREISVFAVATLRVRAEFRGRSRHLRPDGLIVLGSMYGTLSGSQLAGRGISAKSPTSMQIFMPAHGFATKPRRLPIAGTTAVQT